MTNRRPSRRTIILGAAASAVAMPVVPSLLTPQAILASAAGAGAKPHRGPAHDWLDAFVAKKEFGQDPTNLIR